MKNECKQLENDLKSEYEQWNYLYEHGGQDPFWADGCNLNLVRNHIIFAKEKCKGMEFYPEIYYKELPPEVDNDYMARSDYIRKQAKASLQLYLQNSDYKWLSDNVNKLSARQKEATSIINVLNYAIGLQMYIKSDMLVDMRRHIVPNRYIDSFVECRKRVETILNCKSSEKTIIQQISNKDQLQGQMNIFDFI